MLNYPIYSGCGNTFALVDLDQTPMVPKSFWVKQLCENSRLLLDGVLFFKKQGVRRWKMRIFNSDGGEAEMCGNGVRCLARKLRDSDPDLHKCTISTLAGDKCVQYFAAGISVSMGAPSETRWDLTLDTAAGPIQAHLLNTGVPHVVTEVSELEALDVQVIGSQLRHHPLFQPAGANANFFQRTAASSIAIRTFERGCERETQACGTGATAAALVAASRYGMRGPIQVQLRSGDSLHISFSRDGDNFSNVCMIGTAQSLCETAAALAT